ncbi:hypothetical protein KJA13_02760 [Patescibacteria group bacterium]|nr:hypothetical protein [Patescibacteria group bacterium]
MDVGFEWQYQGWHFLEGKKGSEINSVSAIASKEKLNNKEAYLFQPDKDRFPIFYYSLEGEGIYLYKIKEADRYIICSSGLLFFPRRLQIGREYNSYSKMQVYDTKDRLIEEGIIEREVKLEGTEDISVPAGRFKNCLKISTFFVFKAKTALRITEELFLAKGIGNVQVKEKILFIGSTGKAQEQQNEKMLKKCSSPNKYYAKPHY